MLTVEEPRWHLENRYDANGRCVHQRTRWPDGRTWEIDVAYKIGKGGLTETTTTSETGGRKTVYHFGDDHYGNRKSSILTVRGQSPSSTFGMPGEAFATGVTIRCYDAQKRLLRTVDGEYKGEDATDAMAARACWEWAQSTNPPSARPDQDRAVSVPSAPEQLRPLPRRPVDPAASRPGGSI